MGFLDDYNIPDTTSATSSDVPVTDTYVPDQQVYTPDATPVSDTSLESFQTGINSVMDLLKTDAKDYGDWTKLSMPETSTDSTSSANQPSITPTTTLKGQSSGFSLDSIMNGVGSVFNNPIAGKMIEGMFAAIVNKDARNANQKSSDAQANFYNAKTQGELNSQRGLLGANVGISPKPYQTVTPKNIEMRS